MKLFLLLGEIRYGNDAEKLLWHICRSYSLSSSNFVPNQASPFHYCYHAPPASKRSARDADRRARLQEIEDLYKSDGPFQVIGFGWLACDLLFSIGKSKTKTRIGTKWAAKPNFLFEAWLTYDPAAALFDPNLVVDISWVVVHAAQDAGIQTEVNTQLEPFDWSKYT